MPHAYIHHTCTYAHAYIRYMYTYATRTHTLHIHIHHMHTYATFTHTPHTHTRHMPTYVTSTHTPHTPHAHIRYTYAYTTCVHIRHVHDALLQASMYSILQRLDCSFDLVSFLFHISLMPQSLFLIYIRDLSALHQAVVQLELPVPGPPSTYLSQVIFLLTGSTSQGVPPRLQLHLLKHDCFVTTRCEF